MHYQAANQYADARAPSPEDAPIFGAHALELKRAGLAVLPAKGKKPIRAGFNNWQHAPGQRAVEKWCATNATDNIVYIPGLSRTKRNPHGLVIVDADNAEMVEVAEKTFGSTPAMIDTRRGRHAIYRADDKSLGNVGSLRKAGFDIDIKHGQKGSGISVAPPSRHPDQRDFAYRWAKGSGIEALADLPRFDARKLQAILERSASPTNAARPIGEPPSGRFREGSRGLALNDYLVALAHGFDTIDDALDAARTWNDGLPRRGQRPLEDCEVVERTNQVWRDLEAGKIEALRGRRATAMTDDAETRWIAQHEGGDAALMLLMTLRAAHGARCRDGGTFRLVAKHMVRTRVCGTWAARKYREARDLLLRLGLIREVTPAIRHTAAEYTLVTRSGAHVGPARRGQ